MVPGLITEWGPCCPLGRCPALLSAPWPPSPPSPGLTLPCLKSRFHCQQTSGGGESRVGPRESGRRVHAPRGRWRGRSLSFRTRSPSIAASGRQKERTDRVRGKQAPWSQCSREQPREYKGGVSGPPDRPEDKPSTSEKHRDSRQRPEDSEPCGGQARALYDLQSCRCLDSSPDDSYPGREAHPRTLRLSVHPSSTTHPSPITTHHPPSLDPSPVHHPSSAPLPSTARPPVIQKTGIRSSSMSGTRAN